MLEAEASAGRVRLKVSDLFALKHIGFYRNFLNFVHQGFAPKLHATAVGQALEKIILTEDYRNLHHWTFFESYVAEYFLSPLLLQYFSPYHKTAFGDEGIDRRSMHAHSAVYQTVVQVKLHKNQIGHDEITKFIGAIDLFEQKNGNRAKTYGVYITASGYSAPVAQLERVYRRPGTKRALFLIDRQKLLDYLPLYQKFYGDILKKTKQFRQDDSEENRRHTIHAFRELHDEFILKNISFLKESFSEKDRQILFKRKRNCEQLYINEGRYKAFTLGRHKMQLLTEAFETANRQPSTRPLDVSARLEFMQKVKQAGIEADAREIQDFFDRKFVGLLEKHALHLKTIHALMSDAKVSQQKASKRPALRKTKSTKTKKSVRRKI